MNPPNRFRRFLPPLLAVLASAVVSLALSQVNGGIGADFVGRWLIGWASLSIWALPIAWLLTSRLPGLAAHQRRQAEPAVRRREGR